jgi:hypothetical protein
VEEPEDDEEEDLWGETIEDPGDRVMEVTVEFVHCAQIPWLIFEEIAWCLEEVGEKADTCPPDRSFAPKTDLPKFQTNVWVKRQDDEAGQDQVDDAVAESCLAGFETFPEAGAGIPVCN